MMFKPFKLDIIKNSWFKTASFWNLKQTTNRFDRYDVELMKFIKGHRANIDCCSHNKREILYLIGWRNITVSYNEQIMVGIDRRNICIFPNNLNWKYTPSNLVQLQLNACHLLFDIKEMINIPIMNELKVLNLCNNEIFGDCTQSLCHFAKFPALASVNLEKNRLHCPDFTQFRNTNIDCGAKLRDVFHVNLSNNLIANMSESEEKQLDTNIDGILSLFPKLLRLQLENNKLDGLLYVNEECLNFQLRALLLSNNKLIGIKTLQNLKELRHLHLSGNLLQGDIMKDYIDLLPESMVVIELFDNEITGTLDLNNIGKRLRKLLTLKLNYNKITNIIVTNQNVLESLSILLLDLSHNEIECRWSEIKWNIAHDITIYLDNNKLYGNFDTIDLMSTDAVIDLIDISNNNLSGLDNFDLNSLPLHVKSIRLSRTGDLSTTPAEEFDGWRCQFGKWRRI